jgi:hypothetical protein
MLALARATGHREVFLSHGAPATLDPLAVVVDNSEALVGTISPPDRCQAIVSANPALVAAVRAYTRTERAAQVTSRGYSPAWPDEQQRDWLTWEEEKQRRLLRQGRSVA